MHFRPRLALSVALALVPLACTLDARDLDAFRTTAAGPEKLAAVMGDCSRPAALRAEAALRLLDLERADVDGRALLIAGLETLDPTSRRELVPTFEHGLTTRMRTAVGRAPSLAATRAKDVGVHLLGMIDAPDRARFGATLVRWMSADPDRRGDVGEYPLEQVAGLIGQASAPAGCDGLVPALSPAALARLVATIAEHADEATRRRAATHLAAIEEAYRARPDDVVQHALPALGRFVDTAPARARLVAIAGDPTRTDDTRQAALALLRSHATEDELPALGALALDDGAALSLREAALARIGELRTPASLPVLLGLATTRTHRSLRQPAAELAIELGGERGLPALFRALPSHWNVTYARSELTAYAERVERLRATSYLVTLLGKKLYSPFWWSRVIAIRYFAHRAEPVDAARRLRQQLDEKQEITGADWPDKWTVGREAQLALRMMAAR